MVTDLFGHSATKSLALILSFFISFAAEDSYGGAIEFYTIEKHEDYKELFVRCKAYSFRNKGYLFQRKKR